MWRVRLRLIRFVVVVLGIGWVRGDGVQNNSRVVRDLDKYPVCVTDTDCDSISAREGDCFRHQDRRNVFSGICLSDSDMTPCFEHTDCTEGRKCTNQFCGEEQYFSALGELSCKADSFCQDMLLGDHCCFDIRGGLSAWDSGEPDWGKKCCHNKAAPVKQPPDDISDQQIKKLNQKIEVHFKNFEIDNLK